MLCKSGDVVSTNESEGAGEVCRLACLGFIQNTLRRSLLEKRISVPIGTQYSVLTHVPVFSSTDT